MIAQMFGECQNIGYSFYKKAVSGGWRYFLLNAARTFCMVL